jgi:hypothetical protein
MQPRLTFISLGLVLCVSCSPFGVPLKRLDEKVIQGGDIEVHWWTTSSITTMHEHVEVIKDGETRKISELNTGGIHDIVIRRDSIIISTSGTGLFYQLDDSVFGYTIDLDTIPFEQGPDGRWRYVRTR